MHSLPGRDRSGPEARGRAEGPPLCCPSGPKVGGCPLSRLFYPHLKNLNLESISKKAQSPHPRAGPKPLSPPCPPQGWATLSRGHRLHRGGLFTVKTTSTTPPSPPCAAHGDAAESKGPPGFGQLGGAEEGEVLHFRTQQTCGTQGRQGDYRISLGGREDSGASVLCITQAPILGPSSQRGGQPPWASPSPGGLTLKPVPEHKPSKGCQERGKKNPGWHVRLTPQTRRHQDHH